MKRRLISSFPSPHAFTLVETLVAIAILLVVVVTPYYAADRALVASAIARDELLANMLGQQAIENVRSIRDSNFLSAYQGSGATDWMSGLDGNGGPQCFSPNFCTIGTSPLTGAVTVQSCSGGSCSSTPLYEGSASAQSYPYFFNQAYQGTQTPYVRSIQIFCVSQAGCVPSTASEVEVVSTVQWTSNIAASKTYSIEVDDFIDNWLSAS
jgi:prepilin-type N-terminal cleavage/methylation domain-containing protein